VLIAGGIGITPTMNMMLTFTDLGDGCSVLPLNGNKDGEAITLRDEPEISVQARVRLTIVHLQ